MRHPKGRGRAISCGAGTVVFTLPSFVAARKSCACRRFRTAGRIDPRLTLAHIAAQSHACRPLRLSTSLISRSMVGLAATKRERAIRFARGGEFMNPPPNDDGQYAIGLYVINLDSSTLPMPLDVPFRHELIGFTVFRSRALENGRERFFLHLGYFESVWRAEDALTVVRKHYPAAWISVAPETHLGSLDDTLNTEFRLLRTAYARVVTRQR